MSMPNMKRSLKSSQPQTRVLFLQLNGVPATPIVTGLDRLQVSSVVDNGVGDYTIIFKNPLQSSAMTWQLLGHMMITGESVVQIIATAYDRITIKTFAMDGTTPADANLQLSVIGTDSRISY